MQEQFGDIWENMLPDDFVVVTTNNTIRQDGALVMGRGIALEANQRFKRLQFRIGNLIRQNGLRVEFLPDYKIIVFPVKYHYRDTADLNLILRSTLQLLEIADKVKGRILMPRPGCGGGHLDWAEVKPMIAHYLVEDKFVVFTKGGRLRAKE